MIITLSIQTLEALSNWLARWEDVMTSAKSQFTLSISETYKQTYKPGINNTKDKADSRDKFKSLNKPKTVQALNGSEN